ncbi:beta-lactamase/transpeptidase-like protein [Lipomyces starkeyi]
MSQVQGHCDSKFEGLRNLFQSFIDSGEELGASIVVNIDGENVVDVWGGFANASRTKHWEMDTIVNVFSTTKTVSALAALTLIDRGLLDVNGNVSQYWPEFGANGKEDILVRHILSHTSGVSGWDEPVTVEDLCNFEKASGMLTQQAPWWTPGTASGYHSWTMGFLIGELVRRVTSMTLKEFVAKEIAGPLDADFQIGALEKDWDRISDLIPPRDKSNTSALDPQSIAAKTFKNPILDISFVSSAQWRQAELGAANGHGNARSVARLLSVVALGGQIDGKRHLLSPETIDLIFQQQADGVDLAANMPLRFGIGFGLSGKHTAVDWMPCGRICFWGGYGGSIVIMDLDRRLTISYVMNKMDEVGLGSDRTKAYVEAVYKML